MTEQGEKRLAELCEENRCEVTYYDLASRRWWCPGHARGFTARWPIRELGFDNSIHCAQCGSLLNDCDWAHAEVF